MSRVKRRAVLGAALVAPMLARHGFAQSTWPNGPVRLIVAFAAGGAADTVARNLSVALTDILKQQILIENRTGGNAVVAANAVLQAPRDGQTWLIDAANQVTNPVLVKDLPFDYEKAWIPMCLLARFPQVVGVKHDFPAKTIEEYIAMAKEKPGTISYGTPPAAGMGHLTGEALQRRAGIRLIHAPYRGGADAARDIAAGSIDSIIITTSSARPPVAAGRARILAVTSEKRSVAFPDAPALAERGFPGFDMFDWNGLFAATGTPTEIITRMHAAMVQACRDSRVKERLEPLGAEMAGNTQAEFSAWLTNQRKEMGAILVDAGVKLQ